MDQIELGTMRVVASLLLLAVIASRRWRRSNLAALLASLLVVAGPLAAQGGLPTVRLGTPAVQMSGSPGPNDQTLLAGVIGATRLSNGTIVVGDGAFPRILLFSSFGQVQQAVGRTGDGPGELRMPRWVGRCGGDEFAAMTPPYCG